MVSFPLFHGEAVGVGKNRSRHGRVIGRGLAALAAFALLLAACLGFARPAEARDYTMDRVTIDATVQSSGVLDVQEVRTFSFDGAFNGVYFTIPTGDYVGERVELTLGAVGVVDENGMQVFRESDSGEPGTYTVTDYSTYEELKLYYPAEDCDVNFAIGYQLDHVVQAWADTGELYWKFVSDGWDVVSNNVTCTVHLPVPDGTRIAPGGNVRAWGHGSLDSTVGFSGDDVIFSVPAVGTDQYAEARIVFPLDWLDMEARSEAHLTTILDEEARWADEANAERSRARIVVGGASAIVGGLGALGLIVAAVRHAKNKRLHTPQFQELYWRDVPSADHPAVIGTLVNDGECGDKEFLATLMRLTDEGAIGLDLITHDKKTLFGNVKVERDYQLTTKTRSWRHAEDPIDRGALSFLFDNIAPHTEAYRRAKDAASLTEGTDDDGDAVLDLSEMQAMAKRMPATYTEALDVWRGTVKAEAERRGFFTDSRGGSAGSLYAIAILDIFAAIAGFIAFIALDMPWYFLLLLILPVAGCVACVVQASTTPLSPEAVEIRAKAEALKRWLEDFTNLDEAVPGDVVLWNRLLVMAVVLGVADRVIEQLRVAAPAVIDDPAFYPYYVWYLGYDGAPGPWSFVQDAYNSSYRASQAAMAASSDSSGAGAGGGFSGGGGGGFGGGGGGGAF